ncbi:MAG: WYL domain-containing protein [Acidimicrobiia bacterium]|nr:WYL domain-containing protein [Acidimicrobiia bacterium]
MTDRTAARLSRILSLIPWLIVNEGASVDEVCTRFGYEAEDDLLRDLNTVMVCGLPGYGPGDLMDAYIDGEEVFVDMADYFANAPRPTAAEALTMLASAMTVSGSGLGNPHLDSAIEKLSRVLLPDPESVINVDVAPQPDFVGPVSEAASNAQTVTMVYTGLADGQRKERVVEPWSVFTSLGNWYVRGWCRLAQGERIFRVDRINSLEINEETFEAPESPPKPEVHYTPTEDAVHAIIDLGRGALWVLDYYPVDIIRQSKKKTRIRFATSEPGVAARLLLRLGENAKLVEGDEVREEVVRLGSAILARYGE